MCDCQRIGCEHDRALETPLIHAALDQIEYDRARETYGTALVRCKQSVCPGSLGGDHDGNCPLYDASVWEVYEDI